MHWNLLVEVFLVVFVTAATKVMSDQTSNDEIPKLPSPEELEEKWKAFKHEYGKTYKDEAEESLRKKIFVDNLNEIVAHNHLFGNGLTGFEFGINQFSDMGTEEFLKSATGYIPGDPSEELVPSTTFVPSSSEPIPDEVDWRSKGYVTPVKHQGNCGSCWAFGATGSLEGQHFRKTGKLVALSEQQLVDCVKYGCDGGNTRWAFYQIYLNGGIATEESYPYEARNLTCRYNSSTVGTTCSNYVKIQRTELALKQAVAEIGPISVGIHVTNGSSFKHYKDGVYNFPECDAEHLNHDVLVVGYGKTESGEEYWIVKNSWGTNWGIDGYIWMSRNRDNQCGIATDAVYPRI